MPFGHHIARCQHCGKEWMVGDCIPSICPECQEAGHTGSTIGCPLCFPVVPRSKLDRMEAESSG